VHDAVSGLAEKPLGTVLAADCVFDQLQADLLRSQFLPREIDETIRNLRDGTPDGELASRLTHYAGSALDTGNNFRAVSAERAKAERLG
jgi:hypothetical protein